MFKILLKLTKSRSSLAILLSLLILSIILFISIFKFSTLINKQIGDLYYTFSDIQVSKNIVIVEIDDYTLSWKWNQKWLGRFPFDRKYYAQVIENLNKAWAAVIALDIIFWEESNTESDNILSDSIKKAWNVILWFWQTSPNEMIEPYEKFWKYKLAWGYLSPNIDKDTKIVYSIQPYNKLEGIDIIYDSFSIAILRWFFAKIYNDKKYLTDKYILSPNKMNIGDKIEIIRSRKNKNEVLITYANRNDFTRLSFLDVYNNNLSLKTKEELKDKIIIIWSTATWIKDVFYAPIWPEFWVYSHANMVNTILKKNGLTYSDKYIEWFLIFLLIIISVYFNISRSSYVLVFSNIALVSIFVLWVLFLPLLTNTLINYPFEFLISIFLSLTLSNIVKYLIENRHKTKLNKALSEYVSVDIAREILSWEWKINLDWEKKDIAIFFSDIEWFTSISEKFSPEELVRFLREFLTEMSNIIMDEKGFINKYEWDSIMALWWVFWSNSDSSYQMCLSALKQQETLKKLNIEWINRWFTEIKVRIWMHFWNAIIWNIWSEWRKMEFTALWDSVNLASRLEWVNKFYWTYICASEDVYNIEKNNFEFRYLDKIKVKWKEKSINIYELISLKWELSENQLSIFNKFEEWVEAYKAMDFKEALIIFSELSEIWDKPSNVYKKRCEIYINEQPKEPWDGIWTMTSK